MMLNHQIMIQIVFKLDLSYSVHAIDFYTYM